MKYLRIFGFLSITEIVPQTALDCPYLKLIDSGQEMMARLADNEVYIIDLMPRSLLPLTEPFPKSDCKLYLPEGQWQIAAATEVTIPANLPDLVVVQQL